MRAERGHRLRLGLRLHLGSNSTLAQFEEKLWRLRLVRTLVRLLEKFHLVLLFYEWIHCSKEIA